MPPDRDHRPRSGDLGPGRFLRITFDGPVRPGYGDDADFVDAWYTLARETAGARDGAGGNGRFTFDRYWVQAL
jgi:hypothetical protein